MANEFPHCDVVGVDLAPVQSKSVAYSLVVGKVLINRTLN